MKVKEESEKVGLKLNIQKMKIMASGPITSWQIDGETMGIFRTDFLQNGLVGSPCNLRDSQESSPTPQFKSINSSVLSFLYTPILIHDYWRNHSFD